MNKAEIAARLRLIAQEMDAGTIDGVFVVTTKTDDPRGEHTSSLVYPGDSPPMLLGAIDMAHQFLLSNFEPTPKDRSLG